MQTQHRFWEQLEGTPTWCSKAQVRRWGGGQKTRLSCPDAALHPFTTILSEMSVSFLGNTFQIDKGLPFALSTFSILPRAQCSVLKADLISTEHVLPLPRSWGAVARTTGPDQLPTLWGCPGNTTRWREKGGVPKERDPTWPMPYRSQVPTYSSHHWPQPQEHIISIIFAALMLRQLRLCTWRSTQAQSHLLFTFWKMTSSILWLCLSYWPPLLMIYSFWKGLSFSDVSDTSIQNRLANPPTPHLHHCSLPLLQSLRYTVHCNAFNSSLEEDTQASSCLLSSHTNNTQRTCITVYFSV